MNQRFQKRAQEEKRVRESFELDSTNLQQIHCKDGKSVVD